MCLLSLHICFFKKPVLPDANIGPCAPNESLRLEFACKLYTSTMNESLKSYICTVRVRVQGRVIKIILFGWLFRDNINDLRKQVLFIENWCVFSELAKFFQILRKHLLTLKKQVRCKNAIQ